MHSSLEHSTKDFLEKCQILHNYYKTSCNDKTVGKYYTIYIMWWQHEINFIYCFPYLLTFLFCMLSQNKRHFFIV